jgi:hypothetical protein
MKKLIRKIACFLGLHNPYIEDGKGGFWTKADCINCKKPLK